MNIIEEVEREYRESKNFGVTFHIDPEAYDCRIGDRITFGDNISDLQCGTFYNWQDIILDGDKEKPIGVLMEWYRGTLFSPICSTFSVPIPDEKVTDEMREDPHFWETEYCEMQFATLNQLLDYLNIN